MGDVSKLLDTIIRAPLWFFFAAMIGSGIPLFDWNILVSKGVTSNLTILGMPLAFYAVVSTALCVSSAVARSSTAIRKSILPILLRTFEQEKWRRRLARLPDRSKAILSVIEQDALGQFYFNPNNEALSVLRDEGMVIAQLVSERGGQWGRFVSDHQYRMACEKHRQMFRKELKARDNDDKDRAQVRAIMQRAGAVANGRPTRI